MKELTKQCTKCKIVKKHKEFSIRKNSKDGLTPKCKTCKNIYNTAYRHSVDGLIAVMHGHQVSTSVHRGHTPPNYSRKELVVWVKSQESFMELYNKWCKSGYKKSMVPSCDRIDDYKPYTFDNIRLVTFGENRAKGHSDMKNGVNNKRSKSVKQYTMDGDLIAVYHSVREAARKTGVSYGNIGMTCRGIYKQTGGFLWEH